MILATHALVGAAIGKNIGNPLVIIPVSLAAHYTLDTIRHGDYIENASDLKKNSWKVFLDLLIGFSIIFSIIYIKDFNQAEVKNILLGMFFSLLPDLLTFLFWKSSLRILGVPYRFHVWIHEYFQPEETNFSVKNALNDIFFRRLP